MSKEKVKRLTPVQMREYEKLKEHGSMYVSGIRRRKVFEELQKRGLVENDSWYWFHLKKSDEQET